MDLDALLEEKLAEYLAQPANFGADDHATRIAEADAFRAGFEALRGMIE